MASTDNHSPRVRCRQIGEADLSAVADLLTRGFPARSRDYWVRGLERMRVRPAPPDLPRFGFVLEADERAVGVILLIFARMGEHGAVRCNMSSWYADPAFRSFAPMLTSAAMARKDVTYINTSPAEHTLPILKARDYVRYSDGQFAALPALSKVVRGWKVEAFGAGHAALPEFDLLYRHAAAGCRVLVCQTPDGPEPFVFIPRRIAYSPLPVMQLVYCRDTSAFVRCAGPVGRALLTRGVGMVLLDANAPVPGLVGHWFKGKAPRYYRGPEQPRLNDLAFTEAVVFGA
jgi:hypothetical protein